MSRQVILLLHLLYIQLQLHNGQSMLCVAFHAVITTSNLVLAMSSHNYYCVGTHTPDTVAT